MSHIHLCRELLRDVALGRIPAQRLVKTVLDHLGGICPACEAELRAWRLEAAEPSRSVDRLTRVIPALLAHQVPRMVEAANRAQKELDELLALAPEERLPKVQRARSRFRSQALALLLLEECRAKMLVAPREVLQLSSLAIEVSLRVESPGYFPDPLTLAYAEQANACRVLGDLALSETLLRLARSIAQAEGVTNPSVLARVDSVEASLCRDQARFCEAERLLGRALTLYSLSGNEEDLGRTRLQQAVLLAQMGCSGQAIAMVQSVLRTGSRSSHPRFYYWCRLNLASFLLRQGLLADSLSIIESDEIEHRDLGEPLVDARYRWLHGKAALFQGRPDSAKPFLLAARRIFLSTGAGQDVRLVTKELEIL